MPERGAYPRSPTFQVVRFSTATGPPLTLREAVVLVEYLAAASNQHKVSRPINTTERGLCQCYFNVLAVVHPHHKGGDGLVSTTFIDSKTQDAFSTLNQRHWRCFNVDTNYFTFECIIPKIFQPNNKHLISTQFTPEVSPLANSAKLAQNQRFHL